MLNDIYLHLSPSHKTHIREMDNNISDMQKENKIRWAQLIQKQSELSARHHALSEKKLIRTKLKDKYKKKKKEMEKYQNEIDDYQLKINSINNEILKANKKLKELTTKMSKTNLPNISPIKKSIIKRKENINEIQIKLKGLNDQSKNLDLLKDKLVKLIDSKQNSLLNLSEREKKVMETLQIPIDDLRLEEITVQKLEKSISEINIDTSSFKEEEYVDENALVKKLEEENEIKKNQIEQIKKRIQNLKNKESTPKSKKTSELTPSKRFSQTQPIKFDKDRIDQFNSTINAFKERQKMIDQLENTTTNVQIAWAADQKQIEDSWMGKMDDMQVLQKRVDEIENLIFDIDELSEKVHLLKEEELIISEKKSEYLKSKSKIQLKLSEISECHKIMQNQVDNYVKKKEEVDLKAKLIQKKKNDLSISQNEIKKLDALYQQYRLEVKQIESKVDEIKGSFNISASKTQISEPLEHVKFSEYLIPRMKDANQAYSKTTMPKLKVENNDINQSSLNSKISNNRKIIESNNDKLSDSTFSVEELGQEEDTGSFIHNFNYSINNSYSKNNDLNSSADKQRSLSGVKPNDSINTSYNSGLRSRSDRNRATNSIVQMSNNELQSNASFNSDNYSVNNDSEIINSASKYESPKSNYNSIYETPKSKQNLSDSKYDTPKSNHSNNSKYDTPKSNHNDSKYDTPKSKHSLNDSKYETPKSNHSNNSEYETPKNNNSIYETPKSKHSLNDSKYETPKSNHSHSSSKYITHSNIKFETPKNNHDSNSTTELYSNEHNVSNNSKYETPKSNRNLNNSKYDTPKSNNKFESINDIDLSNNNQDSQRSEIEIEFSDNENSRSVSYSSQEKKMLNKSSIKQSSTPKKSSPFKDSKRDSIKKLIHEEKEEEMILSKFDTIRNSLKSKENDENQYSSSFATFNPKEYESILNCSDSSRSVFMNNNNTHSIKMEEHPIDTTFNQNELEDDDEIIEEEEIADDNSNQLIEEEEEDIFENLSTYYQVGSSKNDIFPAPELFGDTFHDYNNYSESNEKDFQYSEIKDSSSESAGSQMTPTRKENYSSNYSFSAKDLDTTNANRYTRSHHDSNLNDDSDDEFDKLIMQAQNAIELPLLKSKYQSS